MDYDVWINRASMRVGELEAGKNFVFKDLFLGTEWNELVKGEKSTFGRQFKMAVKNDKIPNISIIESPKGTLTTYQKIK